MTIQRFQLPNNLTVITYPTHDAPVVALQAWVRVGSVDENTTTAGMAHLHEHMLFKGTTKRGVGEIASTVESSGGEINAWTSFEQTCYHLVLGANELETGIDILADALQHSSFDAQELAREIEVVVEEIQRSADSPSRRFSNALFQLMYQKHPYRLPVLGTAESVRSFTREHILNFFKTFYKPSEVIFVVVGDFDRNHVLTLVQKYFGDWQNTTTTQRPEKIVEPACTSPRTRILAENVKETNLAVTWQIPNILHDDVAALDALAMILGGGESSRLYNETRRRCGYVHDIHAWAYTPNDAGIFSVSASLNAENIQAALSSMLTECFKLKNALVSHEELDKVKTLMLAESAYQRETVQGLARKIGFFEMVAGDYAFEENYINSIKALSPSDIRDVAVRYLTNAPGILVQIPENQVHTISEEQLISTLNTCLETQPNTTPSTHHAQSRYPMHEIQLPHGATLYIRHENTPVVAFRAAALGGLRFETAQTSGTFHLISQLWGISSEHWPTQAMATRSALLGGAIGAFTGRSALGLRGDFIAEKAQPGLELWLDALLHPTIHPTDLERERAAALERIKNREDNPAGVAFDLFTEKLFPTHPYGFKSGGHPHVIEHITQEQLLQTLHHFTSPDKLILSVVGNLNIDRTLETIHEAFAQAQPGPDLPNAPTCDHAPTQAQTYTKHLDKKQSHVFIGSMGTSLYNQQRDALEVLSTILSGQSGRLFIDLRDKQSLAYSVSCSSVDAIDPGYVFLYIGTSPDKVNQAIQGIHHHLERLRHEPVSNEELQRAKRYLIGTHAIELQRCGSRAMSVALNALYNLGFDAHTRYLERIERITAHDIQQAAQHFLAPNKLITSIVGPAS